MKTNVGRSSSRTPLKHALFNAELGRLAAVIQLRKYNVPAKEPFLMVDLCAGDGEVSVESPYSSPGIILKHSNHLDLRSKVIFYERSVITFNLLNDKYGKLVDCRNIDSRYFDLSEELTVNKQAVFIYADPNNVDQLPITEKLIKSLTDTTTLFLTLGCNAGGIKRIRIEGRAEWFIKANLIFDFVPQWHDVQLIVLNNDKDQWAYMVTTPKAWCLETKSKFQQIGDKNWPNGVSIYSKTMDGEIIVREALKKLFLTKREYDETV